MKIAIVYASETGNTAQVAQAIRAGCEGHEVVAFGPLPRDVGEAELIFVGSWTDKGTCAPAAAAFLHDCRKARLALFGTAGFGISEMYFASLSDRFRAVVPGDSRVLGSFFCPGKMPEAVRDRYAAQLAERPEDPQLKQMLQAWEAAKTHPDQADLEQAGVFAREVLQKAAGLPVFRPMRRKKQELSRAACEEILARGTSGVLALAGDHGYPYAVPLSYLYEDGKLIFHCAKEGHKLDAIARNAKASFCVVDQDQVMPEEYTTYFRSVITFGHIRILTDDGEKRAAVDRLARKYHPADSQENRDKYIDSEWAPLCMLEMTVEHLSGKAATELMQGREK